MTSFNSDQSNMHDVSKLPHATSSVFDRLNQASASKDKEGVDLFATMFSKVQSRLSSHGKRSNIDAFKRQISHEDHRLRMDRRKDDFRKNLDAEQREEEVRRKKEDERRRRADELAQAQADLKYIAGLDGLQLSLSGNGTVMSASASALSGETLKQSLYQSAMRSQTSGAENTASGGSLARNPSASGSDPDFVISGDNSKVNGFAAADPDSAAARAAVAMADLSDDSADLSQDLNRIGAKNLSVIQDPEVESEADRIRGLNNSDLRKTLDSLADESNVSRLRLKMANPETAAAERRAAASLNALTSSSASGGVLSRADATSAVQVPVNTADPSLAGHVSASRLTSEVLPGMNVSETALPASAAGALLSGSAAAKEVLTGLDVFDRSLSDRSALTSGAAASNQLAKFSGSEELSPALQVLRDSAQDPAQSFRRGYNPLDFAAAVGMSRASQNAAASQKSVMSGKNSQELSESQGLAANQTASDLAAVSQRAISERVVENNASVNAGAAAHQIADEVRDKVMKMASRNLKTLSVDLNPKGLGQMSIYIELDGRNDALNVSLAAADDLSRSLLSLAMPELQESLAKQNITADDRIYDLDALKKREDARFSRTSDDAEAAAAAEDERRLRESLGLSAVSMESAENALVSSLSKKSDTEASVSALKSDGALV